MIPSGVIGTLYEQGITWVGNAQSTTMMRGGTGCCITPAQEARTKALAVMVDVREAGDWRMAGGGGGRIGEDRMPRSFPVL